MIDTIPSGSISTDTAREMHREKLKKTCADFESLFLNYMLKSMRSTVTEGGIVDQSEESKMFKTMFDENLAKEIAASGGLGLGDILLKQLSDKTPLE